MRIGLLVCDRIDPKFRHIGGEYIDMYQRLFPELTFVPYYVCEGEFPEDADLHQVYMITGSRYSVYDEVPWVKQLNTYVKHLYDKQKKLVGLCFGHQMIAQALGGKVEKAAVGWCVGIHTFAIKKKFEWMNPYLETLRVLMLCQDQVVELPGGAEVVSSAPDCPVGQFVIGDQVFGIQGHPEFDPDYVRAVIEDRKERIGGVKADKALLSLNEMKTEEIAQWILHFVRS